MDSGGVDLPLVNGNFPYSLRGVHLRKLPTYRRMRARTPGTMRNLASTLQDA